MLLDFVDDVEYVGYLTRLTKSSDPQVAERAHDALTRIATADLEKVGPKGYIHGWIFVGAPGVGTRVFHPHHGHGTVTRHGKRTVGVRFDSGKEHAFEHSAAANPRHVGATSGHFAERVHARTGKPVKEKPDLTPVPETGSKAERDAAWSLNRAKRDHQVSLDAVEEARNGDSTAQSRAQQRLERTEKDLQRAQDDYDKAKASPDVSPGRADPDALHESRMAESRSRRDAARLAAYDLPDARQRRAALDDADRRFVAETQAAQSERDFNRQLNARDEAERTVPVGQEPVGSKEPEVAKPEAAKPEVHAPTTPAAHNPEAPRPERVRAARTPVADVKEGDYARITGTDQYGQPTHMEGYFSNPQHVRVGRRGSRRKEDMVRFQVSETPSGANGWRGQVLVKPTQVTEEPRFGKKPTVPEDSGWMPLTPLAKPASKPKLSPYEHLAAAEQADIDAGAARAKLFEHQRNPQGGSFTAMARRERELNRQVGEAEAKAKKHRAAAVAARAGEPTAEGRASLAELREMASRAEEEGRHEDAANAYAEAAKRLRNGESGWHLHRNTRTGGWTLSGGRNSNASHDFTSRKAAEQWRHDANQSVASIMDHKASAARGRAQMEEAEATAQRRFDERATAAAEAAKPDTVVHDAEALKPGDRIMYRDTPVTILGDKRPAKDRFGQDMFTYHARREDTGKEGPIMFGPGGKANLIPSDGEEHKPGADTVQVYDTQAGVVRDVPRAEAAAGHQRYARSLGPGTPAAAVGERRAAALARGEEKPDHLDQARTAIAEGRHADAVNHLTAAAGEAPDQKTRDQITGMRNQLAARAMGKPAAKPAAAGTPTAEEHPQKAVFDKLLGNGPGEGMVTHKQTRQIVEQMEAHGWKLTGQNTQLAVTNWEAPDGRKMTVQFLTGSKPAFYEGAAVRGNKVPYKQALAHVVTPTHEEVSGPYVRGAAERVSPGLDARVSERLGIGNGPGRTDSSLDPLVNATRQLSGYGGTQQRPLHEVVDNLRAAAEHNRRVADQRAEYNRGTLGFGDGEDDRSRLMRRRADEFSGVADELERMAAERQAYEAERDRRASLPLDIRPTSRNATATRGRKLTGAEQQMLAALRRSDPAKAAELARRLRQQSGQAA